MQGNPGGLGRLGRRRRRLGFYEKANFPLPQSTLGDFLPRMPRLQNSPYSGKNSYGAATPIYQPLNPNFYKGLGVVPIIRGVATRIGPARPILNDGNGSTIIRTIITPTGTLMTSSGASSQQNAALQLQQQQLAANAAAAAALANTPATTVAAAPTTQTASTAVTYSTDTVGNITNSLTGAIVMTAAQAASAGVTAASLNSGAVPAASAVPSWFTDPTQELITGLPNWGLLALAGGALFLLKGKR